MSPGSKPSAAARRLAVIGVTALVGLSARLALACPVCFSETNQGVLRTYYFTTAFMSLLPLIIIGIIGTWIYRRHAAPAQSEPVEEAPVLATTSTET